MCICVVRCVLVAWCNDNKNKRDNYEETIFTICNVEPLLDGYGADNSRFTACESYE